MKVLHANWRRELRRELVWLLLLKLVLLMVIQQHYFAAESRPAVDAPRVDGHIAIPAQQRSRQ